MGNRDRVNQGVSKRVLLTAFYGTSAETLIRGTDCYTNLYLPNDI